jgi:predicted choloylglycine hydrolase
MARPGGIKKKLTKKILIKKKKIRNKTKVPEFEIDLNEVFNTFSPERAH